MLIELDKLISAQPSGIFLIEYTPTLSPTFIFVHFISNLAKHGGHVIFLSIHTSAELFRITMSKMSQRLDPNAFHFVALNQFFSNLLIPKNENDLLERIFAELQMRIQDGKDQRQLIIFDDLFFLAIPGFKSSKLLQFLTRIQRELPNESLILITTGDAIKLQDYADFLFNVHIKLAPIGAGFGKNITGELEIIHRDPLLDSKPRRTTLHYFCGQRSAKAFVPGTVKLLL